MSGVHHRPKGLNTWSKLVALFEKVMGPFGGVAFLRSMSLGLALRFENLA